MINKEHFIYYFVLITVTFVGIFLLLQKNLSLSTHLAVALMITFFYILWGILHHLINHSTTLKIVLEYVLVGAVGFLFINFLLQNVI